MKQTNKNCMVCIYSKFDKGSPMEWRTANGDGYPGEPPSFETCLCTIPGVVEYVDKLWEVTEGNSEEEESWIDGKVAEDCPGFTPVLITSCAECGTMINLPEYTWRLFNYNNEPVCSQKCIK